jgi:Spy/CpxP family protein refolding chaperone
MKKLIIAALLVVSVSAFAQGGQRMTPEERTKQQIEKWTTDLKLDAKQVDQIKPILTEQATKNQAMRTEMMAGGSPGEMTDAQREAFTKKRTEITEATNNKLKDILNAEQFKKMKEMEEANRQRMRQ